MPEIQRASRINNLLLYLDNESSRSGLILRLLQAVLIICSGTATLKGIFDFFDLSGQGSQSIFSILSFVFASIIVATLTLAMWFSIEWAATKNHSVASRVAFFLLYICLLVWSIGFGYGFWWSMLSSQSSTMDEVHRWEDDLRRDIGSAKGRLSAIANDFDGMISEADALKTQEQAPHGGGTCGPSKGGSCGPLCQRRIGISRSIQEIGTQFKDGTLKKLDDDLGAFVGRLGSEVAALGPLNETAKKAGLLAILAETTSLRENFNGFAAEQFRLIGAKLNGIAAALEIEQGKPNFTCYNPSEAATIRTVSESLKNPPALSVADFKTYLGAESTRFAILKLWGAIASAVSGRNISLIKPSVGSDLPSSQFSTSSSANELSLDNKLQGNDWVALAATSLVDLAILVLSIFKTRDQFENDDQARRWINTHLRNHGSDFVHWYARYQFDCNGQTYITRPGEFWSSKMPGADQLAGRVRLISQSLLRAGLISEIKPSPQINLTAQRILQKNDWTADAQEARLPIYKVMDQGVSRLYNVAEQADLSKNYEKRTTIHRFAGDRRPGS